MPIPPFNSNSILPPHSGDPTNIDEVTPYRCTPQEFVERFNTSPERKEILLGFFRLRESLLASGLTGIQWIGGSFVENKEVHRRSPPGDVDVVTLIVSEESWEATSARLDVVHPEWADPEPMKAKFKTDAYFLFSEMHPVILADQMAYWIGLFSHRRDDYRWKGMLRMDLLHTHENAETLAILTGAI